MLRFDFWVVLGHIYAHIDARSAAAYMKILRWILEFHFLNEKNSCIIEYRRILLAPADICYWRIVYPPVADETSKIKTNSMPYSLFMPLF